MPRIATIFALIACATLALAYTSFDPGPAPLPDDPDNRGTLRFAIPNDPGSMDPGRTSASTDFRVVKCIYEPLLINAYGPNEVEPGTAQAMPTITDQGKTYTFKIRKYAKWSDGQPVTAHDFVFGWRRAMLKETAGKYDTLFDIIKGVKDFKTWRNDFVAIGRKYAEEKDEDKQVKIIEAYPELVAIHKDDQLDGKEKSQQIFEKMWDLTLKRFNERVGIKALDDQTLEVRLEKPTAYFTALCAFPTFSPLPRHILEPMASIDQVGWYLPDAYFGDPERLVSNGPYVLGEWKRKVRMVFDQNPHYWAKDRMGNIRIVQETIPDPNLQFLRFEEGDLDWIPNVGTSIAKKLIDSKDQRYPHVHKIPSAGTYYYEFNCRDELPNGKKNPMTDPLVRRAMGMCINREEIVTNVTQMNEPIALLMVPDDQIEGYTGPSEAGIKFDPEAAKDLMAKAGFPGGEGFPPISITVNNDAGPGHANIALGIKKNWEDHLGIKVALEQIEFKVLLERATNGDYYTRRAGWFGDYADPTTWLDMYRKGDSNNDCKYDNPEYDKLLDKAAVTVDPKERAEILAQAEALLLQEAPIVPIFYYVTVMIYDKDKIDLRPNAWNNFRLEMVPVKRGQ